MTLLDFGARKGAVLQAQAQFEEAAATYRETVLTAFQQVEDNLAATRVLAGVTASQAAAATAANRAETIANNQYLGGIIDYSQVIVAENAALSARETQVQAVVNQQTAVIALVQAIGGTGLNLVRSGKLRAAGRTIARKDQADPIFAASSN